LDYIDNDWLNSTCKKIPDQFFYRCHVSYLHNSVVKQAFGQQLDILKTNLRSVKKPINFIPINEELEMDLGWIFSILVF